MEQLSRSHELIKQTYPSFTGTHLHTHNQVYKYVACKSALRQGSTSIDSLKTRKQRIIIVPLSSFVTFFAKQGISQ